MPVYKGIRENDTWRHTVVTKDGKPFNPAPSFVVYVHSPDGFEWGYEGSGPAQLALALLLDATHKPLLSWENHQDFKREVVAKWGHEWEITGQEITDWLMTRARAR